MAPVVTCLLSLVAWAAIPFKSGVVVADLNLGILYMFAVSSLGVYGIITGGWSRKYSLHILCMFPEGFLHVNPRLRYPCGQVVFCVNLGAFFKCFLQLGWGLTGVYLDDS
jgi:NADH:ubiquinone oxidoreductase subunit H